MQKAGRKTGEKTEMAVRHALGYKQVGGVADGAADAAPSPSRCALGRRSQAHARTNKAGKRKSKAATAVRLLKDVCILAINVNKKLST